MTKSAVGRIGVDIGGTFTDTALELSGRLYSSKVLTTYAAPEQAILDGIRLVLAAAGVGPEAIGDVIHGTTLVTNALIARRGARTAFVTTAGFRDVIEMRRENRFEQYDLDLVLPAPLIPRADRFTLAERMGAHGEVLMALDEAEVEALAARLKAGGYESVAVGFLHSYANGAHEQRAGEILRAALPGVAVSLSSAVSPRMREFDRFNTVCANAYVQPMVEGYLQRLAGRLAGIGLSCPVFMMHSGGGLISVEDAALFPVRLLESGPAGGAIFAARYGTAHGLDRVLSFDMGGTTAKICLIEDQRPKAADTFEVARTYRFKKGSGMPISIPVIEMVEIGAGGGSIAHVDVMRQIRVGPESAGSEPGPAAYQRGGTKPTVTDANLLLGRLDPDAFAGGSIALSVPNAQQAMRDHVAAPLALPEDQAAVGICEVVDENMANAARAHAVENGRDLAAYTMIAFGGGAPIHACRVAEKLGVDTVLVPPGAGVGSAIGFLATPFGYETVRSSHLPLERAQAGALQALVDEMKRTAAAFVARGAGDAVPEFSLRAFMRYVGQGWEIPVDLPDAPLGADCAARLRARFEAEYERLFGRVIAGQAVEIVSWSVRASTPEPEVPRAAPPPAAAPAPIAGSRRIFDAGARGFVEAQVVERAAMAPGAVAEGPAVIVEAETSTIVTSAFRAVMQTDGTLRLDRRARGAATSSHTFSREAV